MAFGMEHRTSKQQKPHTTSTSDTRHQGFAMKARRLHIVGVSSTGYKSRRGADAESKYNIAGNYEFDQNARVNPVYISFHIDTSYIGCLLVDLRC